MTVTSLTVTSMENAVLLSIFFNRNGLKVKVNKNANVYSRLIYIRAKAKATSLSTCCIVSNLCTYTKATAAATKIKGKNRFRSSINEPLQDYYIFYNICRMVCSVLCAGSTMHHDG